MILNNYLQTFYFHPCMLHYNVLLGHTRIHSHHWNLYYAILQCLKQRRFCTLGVLLWLDVILPLDIILALNLEEFPKGKVGARHLKTLYLQNSFWQLTFWRLPGTSMKNASSAKVLLAKFTEVIFLMARYDTVIITSGSLLPFYIVNVLLWNRFSSLVSIACILEPW